VPFQLIALAVGQVRPVGREIGADLCEIRRLRMLPRCDGDGTEQRFEIGVARGGQIARVVRLRDGCERRVDRLAVEQDVQDASCSFPALLCDLESGPRLFNRQVVHEVITVVVRPHAGAIGHDGGQRGEQIRRSDEQALVRVGLLDADTAGQDFADGQLGAMSGDDEAMAEGAPGAEGETGGIRGVGVRARCGASHG